MRRRGFITLLGGAAAWPIVARAQQGGGSLRRIAILTGYAEDDAESQSRLKAFEKGFAY